MLGLLDNSMFNVLFSNCHCSFIFLSVVFLLKHSVPYLLVSGPSIDTLIDCLSFSVSILLLRLTLKFLWILTVTSYTHVYTLNVNI